MAMDLAAAADVLKTQYQGPIRKWLNNNRYWLTKIKRNTKDFEGKEAHIPFHSGRNVGVAARAEEVALPAPGRQQYGKLIYNTKNIYGLIRLTSQAIEASKNNAGAFARMLTQEMSGIAKDVDQDQQRQFWRDGSGLLTICGVTTAATTVVVDSTKYIEPGMIIDMRAFSDGTAVTDGVGVEVLTVPNATTFTVASAVTTAVTDCVIKTGVRDASAWGTAFECWGLEALISDANPTTSGLTDTIGNLTRVGNTKWQANVLDNSGTPRALTEDLMQQAFDKCDIALGTTPGLILTNHAILRKYGALLTPDRRYTGKSLITYKGGWKGLEFNDVPVMADKDAGLAQKPDTLQRIYFLDLGAFELHVLKDWGWNQRDGAILKQSVGTLSGGTWTYGGYVDAWEAIWCAYLQLGIDKAQSSCLLDDIIES
jgi:hypothetical protein